MPYLPEDDDFLCSVLLTRASHMRVSGKCKFSETQAPCSEPAQTIPRVPALTRAIDLHPSRAIGIATGAEYGECTSIKYLHTYVHLLCHSGRSRHTTTSCGKVRSSICRDDKVLSMVRGKLLRTTSEQRPRSQFFLLFCIRGRKSAAGRIPLRVHAYTMLA